jgi:hypothetical protein
MQMIAQIAAVVTLAAAQAATPERNSLSSPSCASTAAPGATAGGVGTGGRSTVSASSSP